MLIQHSATALFLTLSINPLHVSAHSLHAGGAMALRCACVDTNIICLTIGCWCSDEMLCHLHLQACSPLVPSICSCQFRTLL
jgi:hypothetical protein